MDFPAHLQETARHLVWMARLPGQLAKEHAELREKQLIASSPLYASLPQLIREELKRKERK